VPVVMTPVDGFSHSTESVLELGIAERLTVKDPPVAEYARYSAPVDGVCARQVPAEQIEDCGLTFAKFSLREYLTM
jgi:hypothetical protein